MDGDCVELDRWGLLFSKQASFFSAITSIMAMQRAKQAGLHGPHRPVLIRYEIN